MTDKRNKAQFGIDGEQLKKLNFKLALNRIRHDLRSDFVYAPHLASVFQNADEMLVAIVKSELKDGKFSPSLPITIEVPKSSRMRVATTQRTGPSFSRPGSILLPKDRLLYQLLSDEACPFIDKATDRVRSFSHWLAKKESEEMFLPTRVCWNAMQEALAKLSQKKEIKYVLKADVANCFGSINQHTMINFLDNTGYPKTLLNALENLLVRFTGERNSRGIIQGVYPSDLLGNFYLTPLDQIFQDIGVPSVRYVDDIYLFVSTLTEAEQVFRRLTSELRSYDLSLNEAKSYVLPSKVLLSEEPDLEELFQNAVEEMRSHLDDKDFDVSYGFQTEWDDEEDSEDESDIELRAIEQLFQRMDEFQGNEEKIERFCLPIFAACRSPIALPHVLKNIQTHPSMTQIYCSYLSRFLEADKTVFDKLVEVLKGELHFDWQRMWILAALSTRKTEPTDDVVKSALDILCKSNADEALRAVAAVFVGKFGSFTRRKSLISEYGKHGSPYLQSAILFAAKYFPATERRTAITSWGGHSQLHELIAKSLDG